MSQHIVVDAKRNPLFIDFKEVYDYRDLLAVLAYRDLRVRYAQTSLGLLWAIIQPLATLSIFFVVFGRVLKVSDSIPPTLPYPVFVIVGLCAWTYFSNVMKEAGNSIITNSNMVKKVFFPRIIIPLSKSVSALVDMAVAFIFAGVIMAFYGYSPSGNIVFLPLIVLVNIIAALGIGIWLSALTIRFRDFQHLVPFLIQFGLYATPIAYPITTITNVKIRLLFYLNPMTTIVDAYRWSVLGIGDFSLTDPFTLMALGLIFGLFITGLIYFRRVEKLMADFV